MPRHDPVPHPSQAGYERAAVAWARYKRLVRRAMLVAAAAIGLSLFYLGLSGRPVPLQLVAATVAGLGLAVLVGTGLMALIFLGGRSGRRDAARRGRE